MNDRMDILVTLSTFGRYSDQPVRLLELSGRPFRINSYGRRMRPEEVVEEGIHCRGLVAGVEEYDSDTLGRLTRLRCISRCGSGIDSIDLSEAKRRGITVLNTPDDPTEAAAELTLSMMLGLMRRLPLVDSMMHNLKWQRVTGNLLAGKTVGIIGLGRIGKRVAELVQAFRADVIGVDPNADPEWAQEHSVELVDLSGLLSLSDIISIHASSSGKSPLRLGREELAEMKQGAWLINVARGDMVDDVALNEAVLSGRLSGAGLDVFQKEPYQGPLCNNDHVILSPHQATLTRETRAAMETHAVRNLLRFLMDEK